MTITKSDRISGHRTTGQPPNADSERLAAVFIRQEAALRLPNSGAFGVAVWWSPSGYFSGLVSMF